MNDETKEANETEEAQEGQTHTIREAVHAALDEIHAKMSAQFTHERLVAEERKRHVIEGLIDNLSDGKPLFERVDRIEYRVHPAVVQVMLTYLMVDIPKKPAELMSAGELQAEAAASMGRMQAMAEALRVGSGLLQDYLATKSPTTGDGEVPPPKPTPQEG